MIRRKPNGQWCDPASALYEWMPVLLSQLSERWFFNDPLRALARYCVDKASELYSQAAHAYKPVSGDWRKQEEASASWGEHRHLLAQHWLRKRDIILKCLKDLEDADKV